MPFDLLVLLAATLVSRFLIARPQEPAFDAYGHLCFVKAVASQRGGPFRPILLNVVGAGPFAQPFMWHWLVGLAGVGRIRRHHWWLNGALDGLFVCVAFVIALEAGIDRSAALLAAAFYVLTPMWFSSIAIGPRIAGFTPRLSAEIATNLFFLVTVLPTHWPGVLSTTIGVLLAMFVLASSKFGVQAMVFLTPLIGLLTRSWTPVVALGAAVALLTVASRGVFLTQLRAQWSHLSWYFRENLRGRMHVSDRNSLRALLRIQGATTRERLLRIAYRLIGENAYTSVLIKMPLLGLIAWSALTSEGLSGLTRESTLAGPVAAGLVLFALVCTRPLLFLGEAERYMNHVAFFVALLAATLAYQTGTLGLAAGILAYGLVYWAFEALALPRFAPGRARDRLAEDQRIIDHLRSRGLGGSVLCYPYHAGGGVWQVLAETPHPAVFCFGLAAEFAARFNDHYADAYPRVRLDRLEEMADEYDIRVLVIDKRERAQHLGPNWSPASRWRRLAVGGDIYDVFERSSLATT